MGAGTCGSQVNYAWPLSGCHKQPTLSLTVPLSDRASRSQWEIEEVVAALPNMRKNLPFPLKDGRDGLLAFPGSGTL